MDTLDYEPTAAARPVTVERGDGTTRVVVAMTGLYAPVPPWVFELQQLALVVVPIYWVLSLATRMLLRTPKPPRAVFEVGDDTVKLAVRHRSTGEVSERQWPRAAVVEVRPNRYESGVWIEVAGVEKDTFLRDLCREDVERLVTELRAALDRP